MERKYTTIWYQTIDSTNSEARRRLAELDNLSVLSACCQTAGRGQRGNTWSARPGENLTFSILLKFGDKKQDLPSDWSMGGLPGGYYEWEIYGKPENLTPQGLVPAILARQQYYLSIMLTVAITDYLADYDISAKIKWPNDIYCNERKICGILIENNVRETLLTSSILGVGLNINQTVFPSDLPNPTSMAAETGRTFNVEEELEKILEHFDKCLTLAEMDSGRDSLEMDYGTRMYRISEPHEFIMADTEEKFSGIIRGVTDDFRLRIEIIGSGVEKVFSFKEIKYVIDGREQV